MIAIHQFDVQKPDVDECLLLEDWLEVCANAYRAPLEGGMVISDGPAVGATSANVDGESEICPRSGKRGR